MGPDVALLLPSLLGGGVERVFITLAQGFVKRGLKVDLVLAKAEGPLVSALDPRVRLVDLNLHRRWRLLRSYFPLRRYFHAERPAWAIPVWDFFDIVPLKAALDEDVRALWVLHNTPDAVDDFPLLKRQLAHWALRQAIRLALKAEDEGKVLLGAVSKGVWVAFSERYHLPLSGKDVYPNPVDFQRVWLLSQEGINHPWVKEEKPFFLAVGRLSRQKGFPLLLEAFARLRGTTGEDYRLLILGEGPERPYLLEMVRRLGIEGVVDFPGFVSNPYPYFRRARAYVMTSEYEGLPLVLLEALALGVPIIAAEAKGGVTDALGNGKFGLVVPRSADALALAMEHVASGKHRAPLREEVLPHLEQYASERAVEYYMHQMGFGGAG